MSFREIDITSLERLVFNEAGLIPVIASDKNLTGEEARISGSVLMMAWANELAIIQTMTTRKATFWSRSRGKLWTKGESSGNFMIVRAVLADCDLDTLIYDVYAPETSCHRGTFSCFDE